MKYLLLALLACGTIKSQIIPIKIQDFVNQHKSFEQNDAGEINPINNKEVNKLIRFFIQGKYYSIVEHTRSIVWESYETFLSPDSRFHSHKYIVQVKVKGIDQLKYLEVNYDPNEKKVSGSFEWIPKDKEFYLLNKESENKKKSTNLKKLEISNQEIIPDIEDFIAQHQGFIDERERLGLSEKEIVPVNLSKINELVRSFNKSNFSNIEYTRNVIWNSYNTFVGPFDRYHMHSFIAQVKVTGIERLKYLEVYFNPVSEKITTDFKWIPQENQFLKFTEN